MPGLRRAGRWINFPPWKVPLKPGRAAIPLFYHFNAGGLPTTLAYDVRQSDKSVLDLTRMTGLRHIYIRLSEDLVSIFCEFLGGHKSGTIVGGWDAEKLEDLTLEVSQFGNEDGLVQGIPPNRMALNVLEQVDDTARGGATAGTLLRV